MKILRFNTSTTECMKLITTDKQELVIEGEVIKDSVLFTEISSNTKIDVSSATMKIIMDWYARRRQEEETQDFTIESSLDEFSGYSSEAAKYIGNQKLLFAAMKKVCFNASSTFMCVPNWKIKDSMKDVMRKGLKRLARSPELSWVKPTEDVMSTVVEDEGQSLPTEPPPQPQVMENSDDSDDFIRLVIDEE